MKSVNICKILNMYIYRYLDRDKQTTNKHTSSSISRSWFVSVSIIIGILSKIIFSCGNAVVLFKNVNNNLPASIHIPSSNAFHKKKEDKKDKKKKDKKRQKTKKKRQIIKIQSALHAMKKEEAKEEEGNNKTKQQHKIHLSSKCCMTCKCTYR